MFSIYLHFILKYRVFIFIIFSLLGYVWFFPSEAFAEPTDVDHTGVYNESPRSLPNYNKKGDIEPDFYSGDRSAEGVSQFEDESDNIDLVNNNNEYSKMSTIYISLKYKSSWYLINKHRKNYGSYQDYRQNSNLKGSISKDIKSLFKIFKK